MNGWTSGWPGQHCDIIKQFATLYYLIINLTLKASWHVVHCNYIMLKIILQLIVNFTYIKPLCKYFI